MKKDAKRKRLPTSAQPVSKRKKPGKRAPKRNPTARTGAALASIADSGQAFPATPGTDERDTVAEPSTADELGTIAPTDAPAESLEDTADTERFAVVGIGASAGGLEALERFLQHMPADSGMAFVIVQHLDPNYKGAIVELLQRMTRMPVVQVADRQKVERDHVYVIPPGKDMSMLNGRLHLLDQVSRRSLNLPIDFFFRSLAHDQRERSIGVVLSGMGSDGTLGLRAIKEKAGAAFVQSLDSAKFDGMPRSAIEAGLADVVAPAEDLPQKVIGYRRHTAHFNHPDETLEVKAKGALEKVFILLRAHTGNDFSLYKKSTILRRIERRMGLHQIDKITNYVRYLRENPREVELLFGELLIGVTSFFRDPDAWAYLKNEALPALLAARSTGAIIRAWVPGCSTGEEAYSLAIVFKEVLDTLQTGKDITLQVFATDLDKDAIDRARLGVYPPNIAADVSPGRLRRYFVREERGYRVGKEIREMVVFAPQNFIMDPPFTKLDILSCRNLLIYLAPELQKRIVPLFHYSLNPGGLLFLGTAETVGSFTGLFVGLESKTRVYRRLEGNAPSVVEFPAAFVTRAAGSSGPPSGETSPTFKWPPPNLQALTDGVVLQRFAPAAILASDTGDILYISGRTGKYLEPAAGKANMNVFGMARDGLRSDLSSAFASALREDRPITVRGIQVGTNGGTQTVDLTVQRLSEPKELAGMVMVVLTDVGAADLSRPARRATTNTTNLRAAELEAELQRFRDEIQTTREEMQTSQEELKSTNEELQSTNEELQSTNEELTTSKEEMQSMNEELQTVNHELQSKVEELSRANNDMKNLLNSTDIATLFLDGQLLVRRFTTPTANIIKLIPSDAGRPITDIAREIEYPQLADDAREVLRTLVFKERLVTGTHNRWFSVRILPYRTVENVIDGVVITFTDASANQRMEAKLRKQADELRQMMEALPHLVWGCRPDGSCDYFSPQWVEYTGATIAELEGYGWLQVVNTEDRDSVRRQWRLAVESGTTLDVELRLRAENGAYRWFQLRSVPIHDAQGTIVKWYGTISDVHDLKLAGEQRQQAADRMINILEQVSEPFVMLAIDQTIKYANNAAQRLLGAREMAGKHLREILPEAAGARFADTFRAVAKGDKESSFEAHFKQSSGNGKYQVRIFPNTDGTAVLFQPRPEDGNGRTVDSELRGRQGE